MKSEPANWQTPFLAPVLGALRRGLDFVLPPLCFGCGAEVETQGGLCGECWGSLHFITDPLCTACGFPFPHEMPKGVLCGSCQKDHPRFEAARAALAYGASSRPLVLAFKHSEQTQGLKTMGRWLKTAAGDFLNEADVIVPVPLHPRRLFARKFNQSALLASALAGTAGKPFDPFSLTRVKHTRSQGGLTRGQRVSNVRAAFRVPKQRANHIDGKNVLLVDDVLTTGATAENCTLALKRAGAEKVFVVTLARVVEPLKKTR